MKSHTYVPEERLIHRAVEALVAALGPVEALRFVALPRPRRIDSVRRHRQWQSGLDQAQFLDQVFGPPPKRGTS
jgi:hypothetical protein